MLPAQLTADSFRNYPPEAREVALRNLELLQQLPLAFVPLVLRELVGYDWKFPAERSGLDDEFAYLAKKSKAERAAMMQPFAALKLSAELEQVDWVQSPADFSERLSAYLWSTHQIDAFRTASINYVHDSNAAKPVRKQSLPRLSIVVVGRDATPAHARFLRLKPLGVHYTNIEPQGFAALLDFVAVRAAAGPAPFSHWYIDGAECAAAPSQVTCVSYKGLEPVRKALLAKMSATMGPGGGGPEMLRSELQRLTPQDLGFGQNENPILSRFQLSLLTEGSGTQIFSTTFVQWAAREVLRRAQPCTLLARYAPRRREAFIGPAADAVDADASLVDAEMGAYYTWINQQRLADAEHSRFVVWYEGHNQAVAIAPALQRGSEESKPIHIADLAANLS